MLATDHLVDVDTLGFVVDTFLQFQLTANQSPLFLLRLDQSLPQSEKKGVKRVSQDLKALFLEKDAFSESLFCLFHLKFGTFPSMRGC